MTRILCLWLPNWPIQRVLAKRRERDGAALVLAAEGPRGGRVVACCELAAARGIHGDMPVAEAKSLVSNLAIARYEPAADRQTLEELAEACEQFSPCVALEEGDAPESLLMDISNLEHLWGSETELAARVEAFFVERGWRARIAVAETVGVAWGYAHFGDENDCKMQNVKCKLQNEVNETETSFHSSFVIRHSSLPIESLRIPADTAALLRQLGIETVGQLLALPREDLASRFGEALLRRIDQWTGAAAEVLVPHRAAAALAVGCELEYPTGDRAVLAHLLSQLVEQLARQLAARDTGAVLLVCELGCTSGQTAPLSIALFEPSANPRQLMELIDLHLEAVALTDEVARVTIRAATTGRLGERQGELFVDGWPRDPHQLALLVNRLSSRLGGEQVLRAELRESPLPERTVRWVAMTQKSRVQSRESRARKKLRRKAPALDSRPLALDSSRPRPLLLYPEPRSIEVTCVVPNGPPQLVWFEKQRERIVQHWGPERVETLWWRGRSVRRDYYRVAVESGAQLWIFRRFGQGGWFLHGVFS